MEIYKRALKKQLRFKSNQFGIIQTEDLFNLTLEQLDSIAIAVNKELKEKEEGSFIKSKTTETTDLTLRLDILKDVIETKIADKERAEKAYATRARNERIKELIAKKQDESLAEKDIEELKAMLEE